MIIYRFSTSKQTLGWIPDSFFSRLLFNKQLKFQIQKDFLLYLHIYTNIFAYVSVYFISLLSGRISSLKDETGAVSF